MMPETNGFRVPERLKAGSRPRALPVNVISALGETEVRSQGAMTTYFLTGRSGPVPAAAV